MNMAKILKNTGVLLGITVVSGALLGVVYEITKAPIDYQNELKKQKAYEAVFEGANNFEELAIDEAGTKAVASQADAAGAEVTGVAEAKDASGASQGYVFTVVSHEGYGGDISFAMGVDKDGMIKGISFLSISETAGLGMKANTDEFKSQFSGLNGTNLPIVSTKDGATADNEIDAISGATYTTKAVTGATNAGMYYFQYLMGGAS